MDRKTFLHRYSKQRSVQEQGEGPSIGKGNDEGWNWTKGMIQSDFMRF